MPVLSYENRDHIMPRTVLSSPIMFKADYTVWLTYYCIATLAIFSQSGKFVSDTDIQAPQNSTS